MLCYTCEVGMKKKGPYILFIILIGLLGFILGVQYGKRLTVVNQVTEKVNSLVKDLQPSPTHQEFKYKKIVNKDCSVAFTIPDTLKVNSTKSMSILLTGESPSQYLSLSCQDQGLSAKADKYSTKSITLNDKTITAYAYTITQSGHSLKVLDFSLPHPTKSKKIHIIIDETLYSLFANSVNYL